MGIVHIDEPVAVVVEAVTDLRSAREDRRVFVVAVRSAVGLIELSIRITVVEICGGAVLSDLVAADLRRVGVGEGIGVVAVVGI